MLINFVTMRTATYPFGAPRTTDGSALPTDYTFTGQKSDDSTGLMFYGARYYDTSLGRFTQADSIVPNPLNPQSLNRFAYVLNNPLKYTDPTGHVECWDEDCNGGPSGGGGGGDNGGGSSGNVNPCNADPTAEGCPGAQEAVPPAETGDDQGTNKAGKCDVASADSGFGSDCGGNEEQQKANACASETNALKCERMSLWADAYSRYAGDTLGVAGGSFAIGAIGCGAFVTGIGAFACVAGIGVGIEATVASVLANQTTGALKSCQTAIACVEKTPLLDMPSDSILLSANGLQPFAGGKQVDILAIKESTIPSRDVVDVDLPLFGITPDGLYFGAATSW